MIINYYEKVCMYLQYIGTYMVTGEGLTLIVGLTVMNDFVIII